MSKNLRIFLLSILVIVLAASASMAAETIKFKWTGTNGSYWGHASNWLAVDSNDAPISYDKVKDEIADLKDGIEFYPGKVRSKPGAAKSYEVVVSISKDVSITMTQGGNAVGGIVNVKSIDIEGASANNTAKVTIDMGSDSWFETTPSILVANQFSGLTIRGTHNPAFKITAPAVWKSISADLALYMPVSFVSDAASLSLDVSNASLTIGDTTLLGASAKRKTYIAINQEKTKPVARLVFDVAYAGKTGAEGSTFDTKLLGKANRIDVLKDVVLDVWGEDVCEAVFTDSFDKGFAKGGPAKLTLRKLSNKYGRAGHPVVSTDKFSVLEGTLAITGKGNAPLGRYTDEVKFNVAKGAALDLGEKTVSTDQMVTFVVDGEVLFHEGAIDVNDTYTGGQLKLSADVSIDVHSTGAVHFFGSQAIHYIKGNGKIDVANSSVSDAILILTGVSEDIEDFTGIIESLDVGIVKSWDVLPFLTNGYGEMTALYVFGPEGSLTLDAAKLAEVEDLDISDGMIYLRSNIPGSTTFAQLSKIKVGSLKISGDVTLGEVRVDGTKDATGVGTIEFLSKDSRLTVDELVIHANADKDFKASAKAKSNQNVYVNVYAIDIVGPGVFAPKAIENGTTNSNIKVGTEDSVLVGDEATLELKGGVKFPFYNSLLLKTSSIDVENNTSIPGNFVVDGSSRIRVSLTSDNTRTFEASKDIERAAIVVGGIFKLSGDTGLSVDITSIEDPSRFLGIMYGVVGYPSFDIGSNKVTSVDVDIIGDYGENKSINLGLDNNGLYAQLVKWFIKPEVGKWKFTAGGDEFGNASKQFIAEISYDVPGDIQPERVVNYLDPKITLLHKGKEATPQLYLPRDNKGRLQGVPRQNIKSAVTGENLAFLMLSADTTAHKLILSGTSYKTSLDIEISLSWSKAPSALAAYKGATITYTKYTPLGEKYQHNGPVVSEDLVDLKEAKRPLTNPKEEPEEEDIYLDPKFNIVDPINGTTFEAGDESSNFELTISGMTKKVITTSNSMPELVNGVYVWRNSAAAEDVYTITTSEGENLTVKDVKVTVDGAEIPIASVDIRNSGNGVLVSIPVSLLGGAGDKKVDITATTDNGRKVHIVTEYNVIINKYQDGEVNEGEESVTFTNGGSAENHVVADVPLEGIVSFDVSKGDNPAGLTWNNAGIVISYTLSPNIAPGTYNMVVLAYNENNEGRRYEFTVVVSEPVAFKVTVEDLSKEHYEGTNYVACATAENVPEGEIVWTISDVNWLSTTMSGDTFVIYGQFPAYAEDASDYKYTVTATVGEQKAESPVPVSVDEDNAENKKDELSAAAGTMTYSGEKSKNLADRNYEVVISFDVDYYDFLEPEDFNLPHWLVAVPTLSGDDEVKIGYTIKFREGAQIPKDAKGVVRFEDPDTGDIVTWDVTFDDDTTEPVVGDFFTILPAEKEISLKLNTTESFDLTVEGSVKGELSYTSSAPDWVTVTNEGKVTVAPTDESLVSATPHTVTITAEDSGRTGEGSTQKVTLTITVTPADKPEPKPEFSISTSTDVTMKVGATATFTVNAKNPSTGNAPTYSADVEPATGLTVSFKGNVGTLKAEKKDTYTVTVKGTDAAGSTAKAIIKVTVTDDVDPDDKKFSLSVTSKYANGVTFDISKGTISLDVDAVVKPVNNQGTVSYTATSSSDGLKVVVSGNTATVTATKTGKYTVTIKGTDAGRTTDNTATATINVTVTGGDVGSSSGGGGCDAGFGALALALAAPLFLRRRRS